MTPRYRTLEEIADAYLAKWTDERTALFQQGRVVQDGVTSGFKATDICRHVAGLIRRTERTVYNRYKVAATFTDAQIHPELDWTFHLYAAETKSPHEWLQRAAEMQWSTAELSDAIHESGGNVTADEPRYLMRREVATVVSRWGEDGKHFITLQLDTTTGGRVHVENRVLVTIQSLKAVSVPEAEPV